MKRIGATVALASLAVMSAVAVPVAQSEQENGVRWGYPVVRIGQSYNLKDGEVAREVTVIFGDAYIDGRVNRDVVVVLGSAHLSSTAAIDGSLVVVGGSIQAAEGAKVREDLFVGGGGLEAPIGFAPSRRSATASTGSPS